MTATLRRSAVEAIGAYFLVLIGAGAVMVDVWSDGAVLGPIGELGATIPAIPLGSAFLLEVLLSFILMFVIMAVATDERVAGQFAGVAVGLTVGFDALMGGPLTGASVNPARSLGPASRAEGGRRTGSTGPRRSWGW